MSQFFLRLLLLDITWDIMFLALHLLVCKVNIHLYWNKPWPLFWNWSFKWEPTDCVHQTDILFHFLCILVALVNMETVKYYWIFTSLQLSLRRLVGSLIQVLWSLATRPIYSCFGGLCSIVTKMSNVMVHFKVIKLLQTQFIRGLVLLDYGH